MSKTAPKIPQVWEPAKWELADASALQALVKGEADAHQQQRALNWIIYNVAGTYDLEYRSEPRDHAFSSGRRFVGLQILKLLKINTAAFKDKK
jgi:hypothetical protein